MAGAFALEYAYPEGHIIDEAYVDRWDPVLVARLKAAAQRLAATLNGALR